MTFHERMYPTMGALTEARPVAILRDGRVVATVATPNDVLQWMHRHTPHSLSHALQHEGYSCRYATPTEAQA